MRAMCRLVQGADDDRVDPWPPATVRATGARRMGPRIGGVINGPVRGRQPSRERLPGEVAQLPVANDRCRGREIWSGLALLVQVADPGADEREGLADSDTRSLPTGHREPEVERLGSDEQLDGEDPFDVLDDRAGMPRRDRSHRDVVLL